MRNLQSLLLYFILLILINVASILSRPVPKKINSQVAIQKLDDDSSSVWSSSAFLQNLPKSSLPSEKSASSLNPKTLSRKARKSKRSEKSKNFKNLKNSKKGKKNQSKALDIDLGIDDISSWTNSIAKVAKVDAVESDEVNVYGMKNFASKSKPDIRAGSQVRRRTRNGFSKIQG